MFLSSHCKGSNFIQIWNHYNFIFYFINALIKPEFTNKTNLKEKKFLKTSPKISLIQSHIH